MLLKTVIGIILYCQFNYLFGQDIDLSNHPFRQGETDHYEVLIHFNRVDTINVCEEKEWSYNLFIKHIDIEGSNYIYGVKMAVNGRIPNNLINIGTFEFEFKVSTYGEILGIENWSYIKNSIKNRMGLTKEFDVIILFEDLLMQIFGLYGNKYIRGREIIKASQKLVGENKYIDTDVYINFEGEENELAYLTLIEKIIEREKSNDLFNEHLSNGCYRKRKSKLIDISKTIEYLFNKKENSIKESKLVTKYNFEDREFKFERNILSKN